jgi:hypothetical protein
MAPTKELVELLSGSELTWGGWLRASGSPQPHTPGNFFFPLTQHATNSNPPLGSQFLD